MASVYRPAGRKLYRIEFKDQHDRTLTVSSGCVDKRTAEGLAHLIERDVQLIQAGQEPRNRQATWKHLGLEPPHSTARTWAEAVQSYLDDLARRGSKPAETHYREVRRKLSRIQAECGWATLIAVKSADFTRFLARLGEQGRAPEPRTATRRRSGPS